MEKTNEIPNQKNSIMGTTLTAKDVNELIRKMLGSDLDVGLEYSNQNDQETNCGYPIGADEYTTDYDVILPLFKPCPLKANCPNKFSKGDIYRRLAIIDNLYGTNIVRMRQFGLSDLTDKIWNLCNDGNGNHADEVLIDKARRFVTDYSKNLYKKALSDELSDAFLSGYGITVYKKNTIHNPVAPSILSKYIYFLLQANLSDNIGFPIYDSIVGEYAPKIAQHLGTTYKNCSTKIWRYTYMLSEIIRVLEAQDPNLWNQQNPCKTKFALLDHFLWRIGKAKKGSFSLLMTRIETEDYIRQGTVPKRIQNWQNISL